MDSSQLPDELKPRRVVSPAPPRGKGPRDTDVAQRVTVLRAALWGLVGGAAGALFGGVIGAALGWAFVTGSTLAITYAAGGAASTVYAPSSGSTPRKREHSQAESLVARGLYQEAANAFELAVAEDPSDPGPYLRIARIHRDHMDGAEAAARWFRRALREASMHAGLATLTRKELIELYTHRMGAPERALPDLARMAEELEGTPDGEWAAAELRAIKERM